MQTSHSATFASDFKTFLPIQLEIAHLIQLAPSLEAATTLRSVPPRSTPWTKADEPTELMLGQVLGHWQESWEVVQGREGSQ